MTSRTTASFRKAFAALPADIQDRAREAFRLFTENPTHPSLQFKQIHSKAPIFSARITLHYRALAARHSTPAALGAQPGGRAGGTAGLRKAS